MVSRGHSLLLPRLAPLAGLSLLGGCLATEVASVNLDQLLTEENRFRYAAKIETGWRYFARQFLDEDWFGEGVLREAELEPVPDPTGTALVNLLDLDKGAWGVDEAWIHAEQVRQYARYAVFCPSALVRERALLELADHARRLPVAPPEPVPPEGAPDASANPAEIRLALEGLVEVLDRVVQTGAFDATARTDLAASCALLGGLELDIEGGWRLLKVVARFGLVQRVPRGELAPILALSEEVQARLARQALGRGRADPHPRVRAAAVHASLAAYGDDFLLEALIDLPTPGAVGATYRLRSPGPGEEEVLVAVLRAVRQRGLPIPERLNAVEARRLRLRLLFSLVQVAHDYTVYGDRVRAAAMLALSDVSDSGLDTLRESEWSRWWRAFEERERAWLEDAAEAAREAPGAAAGERGGGE